MHEKKSSFMLFGAKCDFIGEWEEHEWRDYDHLVMDVLDDCEVNDADLIKWEKIGHNDHNPPIKITLSKPCLVQRVLRRVPNLYRHHSSKARNNLFVSPNRTKEQLEAHRRLVSKLREKIEAEPELRWVIKNGSVINVGPFRVMQKKEPPRLNRT
ncbi:MAG: hypothetical protein GY816_20395, partial [Cytophagales bacterium]|nr:hypothetical protein [Cytophagales bacterium]